jgi:hypothetical protein
LRYLHLRFALLRLLRVAGIRHAPLALLKVKVKVLQLINQAQWKTRPGMPF